MKKNDFYNALFLLSFTFFFCSPNKNTTEKSATKAKSDSVEFTSETKVIKQKTSVFQCDYMGQEPPHDMPVLFAPEILGTRLDESCFELSISGKEIVFTRDGKIFRIIQNEQGIWSKPFALPFPGGETSFSKDGTKIYFNSRASFPGMKVALNVWVTQKIDNQWTEPKHLSEPVINQTVHAPSIAANGNIYASGIMRLKLINGQYQPPEKLAPDIKGHHPFIASDESFLIFDNHPVSGGKGADLFITFQRSDSTWTKPVSLGEKINTSSLETNAFVTPDQKSLFFTRNFDVYWVKADFIEQIRQQMFE